MNPIRLVRASAGSGKTYFLMEELSENISAGVRPEGLLATTFTEKAAAELQSRIRRKLLEGRTPELASRVFDGLIGTVNSVCGRLLSEYAIEAGLSPVLDVLPDEDCDAVFAAAASAVMERYAGGLEPVAARLSLNPIRKNFSGRRPQDWKEHVRTVLNLARSNGIDREGLKRCGERAVETLKQLFPAELDLSLEEIGKRVASTATLRVNGVSTKKTVTVVNDFLRFPTWSGAAQIGNAEHSVEKDPGFPIEIFREIGAMLPSSRELYSDLCSMIRGVFDCAADSLEAYARYKKDFGLVDFVDQEWYVLELLNGNRRFRELLSGRLSRIMVDEFQDTSPIQLALFLKLNECSSGGSIWVGDSKQAIYGFRGTDPELMEAVAATLPSGQVLSCSWRSRENLVRLANEIFTRAFFSMDPRDVALGIPGERRDAAAGGVIEAWHLCGGSREKSAAALAGGIAGLIRDRGVTPGDICVLLRTNEECGVLAEALAEWNISASAPSGTLLSTPECGLIVSALRYCIDPADTAALATLLALYGETPDWLNRIHHAKESWLALEAEERKRRDFLAEIRELEFLKKLRQRNADATPMELLEHVIAVLDLDGKIAAMSSPDRRMGNLEELRRRCSDYMNRAGIERSAATPAGFLAELVATDGGQAPGFGIHTVNVMTYHKAKGLEWPVVILGSLDSTERASVFDIRINQASAFDVTQPLNDRSIHYWPWPFGQIRKVESLQSMVAENALYHHVCEREREERKRLFYVGLTRARDQVIFALNRKSPTKEEIRKNPAAPDLLQTAWLDALSDLPLLAFPMEEGNGVLRVGGAEFPLTTRIFSATDPVKPLPSVPHFAESGPDCSGVRHVPAHRSPSTLSCDDGVAILLQEWASPVRMRCAAGKARQLGNAFHNYIALNPRERRQEIAGRLLKNWQVDDALTPETLLEYTDRLYGWIAERYPGAEVRCEVPMTWRDEAGTLYQGVIDMLLELPEGYVMLDHKTHPSGCDEERYVASCAAQLRLYRNAVEAATGKPVRQMIVHLPGVGRCYEVR